MPAELRAPTPRDVRLNACGILVAALAVASIVGGFWGGAELYRRARLSDRYASLFDREATPAQARVVRVRQRGDNNRRATVDYEYVVGRASYRGRATVRGSAANSVAAGSTTPITYLASAPHASWLSGHTPTRGTVWPAFAVPAAGLVCALLIAGCIQRQRSLLQYGAPAHATVTKAKRHVSDKGAHWRVEYEWKLLSGATARGRYNHSKKQAPDIGTAIPIVYDRDQPRRSSRYPLSLVAIRKP